jgi:hypothetical protein
MLWIAANPAIGKVIWSAEFESYTVGQTVPANNITGLGDAFYGVYSSPYASWLKFTVTNALVDFDTGKLGLVTVRTNAVNRLAGAEARYFNPGRTMGGVWFVSYDISGNSNVWTASNYGCNLLSTDGAWRNIRALRIGTRSTSSYLATNAVSPTFAEQFAVSFASSGDASYGAALDISNTVNMNAPGNNYGWIGFDGTVPTNHPVELLLDLGGPSQAVMNYVINELNVDAGLRGYTLSTSDARLSAYLGGGWDAILTLPSPASAEFVWSWRFGGNGNVFLDRASVYMPPPEGTVVEIR